MASTFMSPGKSQHDFARPHSDHSYFRRGGNTLGHYDKRYFHGVVSDEERRDTQQHMVRAYLDFFRSNDLDTWIAHGTLLGWWWNGQVCCIRHTLPLKLTLTASAMGLRPRYPGQWCNSPPPWRSLQPDQLLVHLRRRTSESHFPTGCQPLDLATRPRRRLEYHRCTLDRYPQWPVY